MTEKIIVGPVNKGLRTDRTPFVIDNDSFPQLINAYHWRGRIKRKRGTSILGRLNRYLGTTDGSGNITVTILPIPITSGIITVTIGTDVFVDPGGSSPVVLLTNSAGATHTLNRSTGVLTITGSIANTSVIYNPTLPVMGLEDLDLSPMVNPGTLAFDTKYSYNISTSDPYSIYDVSFYKNLATGTYAGYVQKGTWTKTWWNGQDYQQFWTVNYQGALWATNGINIPFNVTNIGMQYKPIITVDNITSGPPAFADLTITAHGLVVGDFVFINEVQTTTGINFQTGYVTVVVSANKVTVEFPNATIATNGTGGIAQYLTNTSDTTKDCLRWYDGDPTDGNPTTPTLITGKGWVNFAPPLSQFSYSIADLPAAQYYLVGARMIVPFKDRLLFFGPVIQTSASGSQTYLQDTVIYSQNGTPYYTCSFTNTPSATVDNPISPTTIYNQILVPTNQTATPSAYFEDQTGFGGFLTAGLDEPINTVSSNEDVLVVGFSATQTRFVYTGNDIIPFNFYLINSELGSGSTFSSVNLDEGVITVGSRGYILTSQTQAQRIDLDIPDQVFQISLLNNGRERICSQRDFINEWVYFTYPSNTRKSTNYLFPTQTLQYNYREHTWSIHNESYTTYGSFKRRTGFIWSTVGNTYPTWNDWNEPWDAGTSTLLQQEVIAGNAQGYVVFRDDGTNESNSVSIQNITSTTVTSPNHCLNAGDFVYITGVLGTIGPNVNNRVFQVATTTLNSFTIDPTVLTGTYQGGGQIKRFYVPFIQTKQFPTAWGMGRKTRIGTQQYLLSTTDRAQIQLLIYLSQNQNSPYNDFDNDSLIYSTVLYTCPESTNLGLTPANINLNMPTAQSQAQIWHRMNTSLIGDTVQIGFTISRDQMRKLDVAGESFDITGTTQASTCVLTCSAAFPVGTLIKIENVLGMTPLNYNISNDNIYYVLSSDATTVTIQVDSTLFPAYISGGIATPVAPNNQTAEVELHGFILDVNPSQMLS